MSMLYSTPECVLVCICVISAQAHFLKVSVLKNSSVLSSGSGVVNYAGEYSVDQ